MILLDARRNWKLKIFARACPPVPPLRTVRTAPTVFSCLWFRLGF